METTNKDIKKIAWALIISCVATSVVFLILSAVIGVGWALITSDFSSAPEGVYNLSMALVRIAEGILFCMIFRKSTFKELKEEKFNFRKAIPLFIVVMFYSLFMSISAAMPADMSVTNIFRVLIVAPIFEELMFRGAIQRTLEKFGGQKFAIMLTTFLFACYHMNSAQFLFTLIGGLIFGYAASKYSLKAAMLLHFVSNLAKFIFTLSSTAATGLMLLLFVASIVVLVIKRKTIIAFFKEKPEKGMYKKAIFNCPMIIFLIIWMFCMMAT